MCSRLVRASFRAAIVVGLCASSTLALQLRKNPTINRKLLDGWYDICKRILDAEPWGAVAAAVEALLDDRSESEHWKTIQGYLESIRSAELEAGSLPSDRLSASPVERVKLLIDSRVVYGTSRSERRVGLLNQPLHVHRYEGQWRSHWAELARQPEHAAADSMILVLKRGPETVPALIDALSDMTATRSVANLRKNSRTPTVLLRHCDLALPILEVITGCRFYVIRQDKGNEWFSHQSAEVRQRVITEIRNWYQQTRNVTRSEARLRHLATVDWDRAAGMIRLMTTEGEVARGLEALHRYLMDDEGKPRLAVADRLAALGDRAGVEKITDAMSAGGTVSEEEVRLLIKYGRERQYGVLYERVAADVRPGGQGAKSPSQLILKALGRTDERLAVPVYAAALPAFDGVTVRYRVAGSNGPVMGTRADMAAYRIQELTHRDFGYDPAAPVEERREAVSAIRQWWETEGAALYGFGNSGGLRSGGIR